MQGEFETYQDLANRTIESKDREISRLLSDNAALQKSSHVHSQVLKTCSSLFLVALCTQDVHLKASRIHGSRTCLLQSICMNLTIALGWQAASDALDKSGTYLNPAGSKREQIWVLT
jgi:hypothetical protein